MAASELFSLSTQLVEKCGVVSKKPERFLSVRNKLASELKSFTKELYDATKQYEKSKSFGHGCSVADSEALPELIVDNFDEEQIWQELELQNTAVNRGVLRLVSKVLQISSKDPISLRFSSPLNVSDKSLEVSGDLVDEMDGLEDSSEGEVGEENEADDMDDDDARSESSIELERVLDKQIALETDNGQEEKKEKGEQDDEGGGQDDEDEELRDTNVDEDEGLSDRVDRRPDSFRFNRLNRNRQRSEVDDRFFRLSELESFLDSEDAKEEKRIANTSSTKDDSGNEDDYEIDYFQDIESEDDENNKKSAGEMIYSDFFEPPDDNEEDLTTTKGSKKKSLLDNNDEDIDDDKKNDKEIELSSFEKRQIKLKQKISKLEEKNLSDKPWQMMGESSSNVRPENSLLAEHLQFDHMTRRAPAITEETTVKLEDIIKRRIKDQVWDDVERKIKPAEEPFEYKKRIVLDQEKSKMSLAEIYEQEYLKKQQSENPDEKEEKEELKEHKEIKKNMASLFEKLDALSNFHFVPKKARPDIKIVNHLPAITVEEVAPVGVSDAALLAPEEIKEKPKRDVVGATERTETDRKRERRVKKVNMKKRRIHNEAKEKMVAALNPGLGNKYSKEAAMKKLVGEGNVTVIDKKGDDRKKSVKSSKDFFSQLQDQVKTSIEFKKGVKKPTKGKQQLSAAKFKL